MTAPLAVTLVGAGAAGQSIHASTIASLPEQFRIRHVVDPVSDVAQGVADRIGARGWQDLGAALEVGDTDVVAVVSPGPVHAEQVAAACEAGVRAVLCEKPLAESVVDAEMIVATSERTGVPVVVGTMKCYDAAFETALERWPEAFSGARLVQSRANVLPNDWLVAATTEQLRPSPASPGPDAGPAAATDPNPTDPPPAPVDVPMLFFAGLMWGLLVHHVPLLARVVPDLDALEITEARPLETHGYLVSMSDGERTIDAAAMLYDLSRLDWSVELTGPDETLDLVFPPGYVPTRSATATRTRQWDGFVERDIIEAPPETAYRRQYRHVHDVATGAAEPRTAASDWIADARLLERLIGEATRRRSSS